ncbi:hypothetical protein GGR52DRAFT_551511 [Hypoxylon sp. FL1284]|nr:hypothetical protein GGR52DRAFT_551511 [Hypoxylon sp. FL1284]
MSIISPVHSLAYLSANIRRYPLVLSILATLSPIIRSTLCIPYTIRAASTSSSHRSAGLSCMCSHGPQFWETSRFRVPFRFYYPLWVTLLRYERHICN